MIINARVVSGCRLFCSRVERINVSSLSKYAREISRWKYHQRLWLGTIFGLLILATSVTRIEAQSNTFPTSGNVGVGTTAPDAKLVVTSNTATLPSTTAIARFADADGVQTSVFLDGFNANGGFLVRRANTSAASPSAVLNGDLLGVFGAAGYGTSAYSGTRARIGFGAAENWTNTANGTFITFNTTANGASTAGGTERMRIDHAGNVGVGTSSPNIRFEVHQSSPFTNPLNPQYVDLIFGLRNTSATNGNMSLLSFQDSAGWGNALFGAVQTDHTNHSADLIFLSRNATTLGERMRIKSYGNVGIGTSTPTNAKLHVYSGASGATEYTLGGNPELTLESAGATDLHILSPNTGSGRVWFGSPSSNLAGGLTYTHNATLSSGAMRFLTGGNLPRMTILGGGNVGIGIEAPVFKLHVDGGQINASGGLCIDGDCKTAWSQVTGTSQWTTGSGSNIYYTGGNVGIGTTSPTQAELVVAQPSSATHFANKGIVTSVSGAASGIINSSLSMYDGTSIHSGDVGFMYSGAQGYKMVLSVNEDTNGSPLNVMTLQGSGNVGVGTTNPQRLMSLYKPSGPVLQLVDNLSGTTASDGLLLVQDGLNSYLENSEAGSVNFRTSATTRMTINASGDVGIGATAPNSKLEVAGVVHSSTGGFKFPDGSVQMTAASGGGSSQWTTSGSQIFYDSGNVAIGTNSAPQPLTVSGYASGGTGNAAQIIGTAPSGTAQNQLNITATANTWGLLVGKNNSGVASSLYHCGNCAHVVNFNNAALVFGTSNVDRMRIDGAGNVGIGTASPTAKLDVSGNTRINGNIDLTGTGNITASGTIEAAAINAKYQDVAEWVPSTLALPAGTVVTLDPTKSNHVEASSKPYDTRVAGVVSAQPGIALGEGGEGKVLVATTGRVRIKVDASHGPIQVGDLLVSSNVPGVAMKSKPIDVGGVEIHRPGTLIGKALEPLAKGQGEILVLLSLQ